MYTRREVDLHVSLGCYLVATIRWRAIVKLLYAFARRVHLSQLYRSVGCLRRDIDIGIVPHPYGED
jgi:hypothetical protein